MTNPLAPSPIRTCVGCGSRELQSKLLRLQMQPSGTLQIVGRPGAGRSAYVHPCAGCITAVAKSRILRRSLKVDLSRASRAAAVAHLEEQAHLPGRHAARR